MKYRKKPVVIEAWQWDGTDSFENAPIWVKSLESDVHWDLTSNEGEVEVWIETFEGDMTVSSGDYIIKGIYGELYPCKPDIFAATYEKVNDDE